MAWKKIAAARFLSRTFASLKMAPHIDAAKRGTEGREPERLRSQIHTDWARLNEKRWRSDSSLYIQL